ncbi:hypothetical protein [Campylobacter rectus]|nr:hypothetical protein [Campylobacter rectus]
MESIIQNLSIQKMSARAVYLTLDMDDFIDGQYVKRSFFKANL